MTKAVAIIVAVLFVLSSNFLSVAVSAADYNKIDISDYVSGREFVGDDVIVSYDLPLDSWTDLYGFETGSNTPMLIDSFNGNLYFSQGTIDEEWSYFEGWEFLQFPGTNIGQEQSTVNIHFDDFLELDTAIVNDVSYPIVIEDYNEDYGNIRFYVDAPFSLRGIYSTDFNQFEGVEWDWGGIALNSVELGITVVESDTAEYQRINGNMFPLGKNNGATNFIDVRDIRSGYGFTLSFDLRFTIEHDSEMDLDGNVATFDAVWLDKNQEEVDRSQYEIDLIPYRDYAHLQYDIDFTVPDGAAYFYLRLNTGYFYVNTAYTFSWVFDNISMTTTLSSIEENSQTMQKVQQKLDKLDEQLGDIKDELTPTPEQNDKAEQLEQEIGNASDKLENNNSTLEDLTPTRPEINTDLTLDEEKLFAVSPLITNIWSLSGMQGHIGIVVLVATVAYIFFGKRDS